MLRILAIASAFLGLFSAARAADAADSLRTWVSVDDISLRELAAGKIATANNASMNLARGMSCQAVFVVNAPLEMTHAKLLKFNPAKHPELEVFQHRVFHDDKDSGFDKLLLDPKNKASAALIRSMGDASAIQLGKREVPLMPRQRTAAAAQLFLSGILHERWTRFSKAGDFGSVGTHDAGSEIRSLLAEEPRVARHFGPLLAPLAPRGAPGTPKYSYWDLSVVDKKAAVQLGAVYGVEMPDRRQVLDVTWYSSNGYLVSITLYELLPFTLDGKARTLVWQGSLVSTTGIEGGLGIKRKIGSHMMLSDTEKWIRIFRAEVQGAH
ncbi:MAG: hypothetical protein ABI318_11450 [Chthoniobacteraceae bacterium]